MAALFLLSSCGEKKEVADKIDAALAPVAKWYSDIVFFSIPLGDGLKIPVVLVLLAFTAIFLTVFFKFINVRCLGLALRTVRGKYSQKDDPGQITHFQALSTAVSATVGLGNIAGVAIAIGVGGPGAVFWMVLMGLLGMTSKFAECTLGVKYRRINAKGIVQGGGMFYLQDGLKERGFGKLGKVLAIIFALACIGGAIGAGNMFQVNQAYSQISSSFGILGGDNGGVIFGALVAVLVGIVILGGVVSIARVTSVMVPFMCVTYVIACFVVLVLHLGEVPAAFATIVKEAFSPTAAVGGFIGGLVQGIRRGVFSNEAGVGSAAIAHGAVKTRKPASEGLVALLEPFIDTVVVCTLTALVIIVTGMWKVNADLPQEAILHQAPSATSLEVAVLDARSSLKVESEWHQIKAQGRLGWIDASKVTSSEEIADIYVSEKAEVTVFTAPDKESKVLKQVPPGSAISGVSSWAKVNVPWSEQKGWMKLGEVRSRANFKGGIWMTSEAFSSVISWFPYLLSVAVLLFAFSTMISWSYYGEQAVMYLANGSSAAVMIYKIVFCLFVVVGASASLDNVIGLSDALFFTMVVPNLIGVYLLLPVIRKELTKFQEFTKKVDAGASIEEADRAVSETH